MRSSRVCRRSGVLIVADQQSAHFVDIGKALAPFTWVSVVFDDENSQRMIDGRGTRNTGEDVRVAELNTDWTLMLCRSPQRVKCFFQFRGRP